MISVHETREELQQRGRHILGFLATLSEGNGKTKEMDRLFSVGCCASCFYTSPKHRSAGMAYLRGRLAFMGKSNFPQDINRSFSLRVMYLYLLLNTLLRMHLPRQVVVFKAIVIFPQRQRKSMPFLLPSLVLSSIRYPLTVLSCCASHPSVREYPQGRNFALTIVAVPSLAHHNPFNLLEPTPSRYPPASRAIHVFQYIIIQANNTSLLFTSELLLDLLQILHLLNLDDAASFGGILHQLFGARVEHFQFRIRRHREVV